MNSFNKTEADFPRAGFASQGLLSVLSNIINSMRVYFHRTADTFYDFQSVFLRSTQKFCFGELGKQL